MEVSYERKIIKFEPVHEGPLQIWDYPNTDTQYCLGIDTSTGLGEDYSSLQVFSRSMPFTQVAHFRAKWSVVDVAEVANSLGRFYNNALVICETNYPGNAVQDALVMTYRYPKNYRAEEHLDEDPQVSSKYGFCTTQAKKWLLIRETQELLLSGNIIIKDPLTIEEMGNFVYVEDKTKTGAAQGFNDDTVMGLMLATHGCTIYPQKFAPRQDKENPNKAQATRMLSDFHKKLQDRRQNKLTHVQMV